MNKIFLIAALLLSLSLNAQKITINKIKFIIDDEVYTWVNGEKIPENVIKNKTEPNYLRTFFKWKPGDVIELKQLEKEVIRSQQRIVDSNLFYSVKVSIIPPRKYPEKRSIIIQVTEGFRYRYGGGNAYGVFGINNFDGNGRSFMAKAGYNIVQFNYSESLIGNSNFYWGTNVKYEYLDIRGYLNTYLGYKITPDLRMSFGTAVNCLEFDNFYLSYIPLISLNKSYSISKNNLLRTGLKGYLSINQLDSELFYKKVGILNASLSLGHNLTIALQGSGGLIESDRSERSFNLYSDDYRSIRSGYTEDELTTNSYLLGNGELRYSFQSFFIPPLLTVQTSAFIFSDVGLINEEIKDAYGLGARLYFASPVFTGFSFCYGWNRDGESRFLFSGTMGF